MQRRGFLTTAAAGWLACRSQLWAAPVPRPRLLIVFLRGGYDAMSLLVPTSAYYQESRPQIAIAQPGSAAGAALALDADWSLHPALAATLAPMYRQGQLAFVPFAGSANNTRSHFDSQDAMELAQPEGLARNYRSGCLNRLAGVLGMGAGAVSFTDRVPLAMQGAVSVPSVALRNPTLGGVDARQSELIASMYRGSTLDQPVQQGFALREEVRRELMREMDSASRNAISARGFELEARRIARMMRERYVLGFTDIGGWDTHVNQGAATGYLASRFEELGRGLQAFATDMGPAWSDTVVVVLSEFGRTWRQNGNGGTDHGHGSVFWVLGGAVRGGRIAGEQVPLRPASLHENRDLPVLNDYRALLAGLITGLYGLSADAVQQVFRGAQPRAFDLV